MSKKVKNYHCLIYTLYKIVQETVDTFLNNGICEQLKSQEMIDNIFLTSPKEDQKYLPPLFITLLLKTH